VQTSAHDVRIEARKIEQLRRNKLALKRQESFNESQSQQVQNDPFLDETDQEVYLSLLFIACRR
jgi:cohesin loading factor subunit SCC2